MGKNYVNGKTFLEKRYDDKIELEDAVHTAILTLKEGFEGQVILSLRYRYIILFGLTQIKLKFSFGAYYCEIS